MQGGVLALDLATSTGWAYAEPGSTRAPTPLDVAAGKLACEHKFGSIRLAGASTDPVRKWLGLKEFLSDMIAMHAPSIIVFEAPFVGGAKQNQNTARMLMGFAVLTEVIAYERGVICYEMNVKKARKDFAGKVPTGRKEAKKAIEERCASLDWWPKNDDEADALAVLDAALGWLEDEKPHLLPKAPEPETDIKF